MRSWIMINYMRYASCRAPVVLTYDGGECFLRKPGQEQYLVTTEDLKETLEYVTGYSLYAYEDEIRQGFISVQGGHRVGVTGKVVLDRGRIMGMKYYFLHQCPSGT